MKCAEIKESKGVTQFLEGVVCAKCSEATERKGDELRGLLKERISGRERTELYPHPRPFCMNIKGKELSEEGFA